MAMMAIAYHRSLQVLVMVCFLWNERSVVAQYSDTTANDPIVGCPIPPGMHNDQWQASYVKEPHAGELCKNFSFPNTQRWSWRCQTTFCCGESCNCNTSVATYPDDCNSYVTPKICYKVVSAMNNYKYECCPGFHENADAVCVPNDLCVNNTLGCQYKCVTTNGTSRCTCPSGFLLDPADVTNTSCIEITTTTTSVTTADTSTVTSLLPLVLTQTASFPTPYIAAAAVGGAVFIGLLVGLVIFVCRPHTEIVPAIVIVGDEIKKKIDDDDVDIVVVGKKQLDEDDVIDEKKKDPLYETIRESDGSKYQASTPSPIQQSATGEVDLTSGGRKAKPNIYSSLSGHAPAARPSISNLPASGTGAAQDTNSTPIRYVVSDNNADYAEIVTEEDEATHV